MNSRQAAQYVRGLEIAQRDALTVVAHGTRKSDGAAIYCVPSRSQANTWHVVVVSGLDLQCDCQAAKYGKYCCHRAATRARMILEGQVRKDAHEREIERAFNAAAAALDVQIDITVAGQAKTVPASALRRSPKLADDQRVFSIY